MSLTTAQVKEHLRIEHDDEDTYIDNLRDAAYTWAEQYCGIAILDAEKVDYLDDFEDEIYLNYNPVQSITSIKYDDADGVQQTQSDYYLDDRAQEAYIKPIYNGTWPLTNNDYENVIITYQAGYATIPDQINQAVLLIVGSLYEQRENHITGTTIQKVPVAAEYLLAPYRIPAV